MIRKFAGGPIDIRIFPTVGRVRLKIPVADGIAREIEMTFAELENLSMQLLAAVTQCHGEAARHGKAFPIDTAALEAAMPKAEAHRVIALPSMGTVGVQAAIPGRGMVGFSLAPAEGRGMADSLRGQLQELEAANRRPS